MRTDVIDQILAMGVHPAYDCQTARVAANMIQCLAQSPRTHIYIARKEVVENMLEICEQKQKIICEQSSQPLQERKEDPIAVKALK
jgi:hypothetical protein